MKIIIVTQYFWPEQFRINDISQGLKEKGHDITVLTGLPNYPTGNFFKGYSFLKGPFRDTFNGINIIRVPLFPRGKKKGITLALNYLSFMLFASFVSFFLFYKKFDKIFVYQLSPITAAMPAVILKWIHQIPIVFWVTDLWPETLIATNTISSKKLLYFWSKVSIFFYRNSDKILVTSKGFIDKIVKRGIAREKISYWPQWGEELFAKSIISKDCILTHQIPKGFIVMFAGNIGTSQSFDTIIDAAEILKSHKDIKFVILGDGLKKDWVDGQIKVRNLKNTIFMLGSKPLETMPTYYSYSNVLLASLKQDPLFEITVPAKIQSYLPSGKPIIVSMDGEGADLIREANAGVACKAGDAQALAKGILKIYGLSVEERQIMGDNARKYFFDNFERENLLNKLEQFLL